MPTLDQLRNKWFLNFSSPKSKFPPVARHKGTHVKTHTDGNLVVPLIDGQKHMKEWHTSIWDMIWHKTGRVQHGSWRLDKVHTLGYRKPGSEALKLLKAANKTVLCCVMLCQNLLSLRYNTDSVYWLNERGVTNACLDSRFPPFGSNHAKFSLFHCPPSKTMKAILGSIDIARFRWDKSDHRPKDPDRHPGIRPTHDVGVLVEGPAVADIEWTFRERWNDVTRAKRLHRYFRRRNVRCPWNSPPPKLLTPVVTPPAVGSQSVQVLHTYGREGRTGYSWSPVGEFTVWAAYLKAIQAARKYIYIEDQFFFPFGVPPCFKRTGKARNSDIVYQLGRAIKEWAVKVIVVVPNVFEDAYAGNIKYQRDLGVHYLANLAKSSPGDFVVAWLENGDKPVYVHSKLMICDDEFAVVGSANVGQRSMSHDGELDIGIVDAYQSNPFARRLREELWAEHLQRPKASLNDPIKACKTFKQDTANRRGRVRPYPTAHPGPAPNHHDFRMEFIIDRYGGPLRA